MKIKQILLCMLLACFILPASAQTRWGPVGGGLLSKSLSHDACFSPGGYAGGICDSFEAGPLIYTLDGKCSLRGKPFGRETGLSAGVGYKF